MAALNDRGFVVTWQSGNDIKAQKYDQNADKIGTEFKVNSLDGDKVSNAEVASLSDGGFVVVWQSDNNSGNDKHGLSIKAQVYTSTGSELGGEFTVNNVYVGEQSQPSVDGLANNGFIVTWQSDDKTSSDKDETAIKAQIFRTSDFVAQAKIAVEQVEIYSPDALPFELADIEVAAMDNLMDVSMTEWIGDTYDIL